MESKHLAEVRHYFSLSQREPDPLRKLSYFEEALALVQEYSGRPDGEDPSAAVMLNLRDSQFRALIQSLPALHRIRLEDWAKYMHFFVQNFPHVSSVTAADAQLEEFLHAFERLHKRYINQH